MGVEWVSNIQTKVQGRIKDEFSASIKKKYKMTDNNFSTIGSDTNDPVFPFVYLQMLPALEQGRDLEGTSINAGLFAFQIDITDNSKTREKIQNVTYEVLRIMKGMGFEVTAMPIFEDTTDTHRSTARYRRLIGSGDAI